MKPSSLFAIFLGIAFVAWLILPSRITYAVYNASYVLGQTSFTAGGVNQGTQFGFENVNGLTYDSVNQRLFVADGSGGNRIMIFNVATSTLASGENASSVLGQVNFTTFQASTTQNGLNQPVRVDYDPPNQRLFVTDQSNNRIMIFNVATSTLASGENASSVLGQVNFTSSTFATTQSGFHSPYGVAVDSANQRLFAVDEVNSRALIFNVATSTLASGENASSVLGQVNFTSSTSATTQNGLNIPVGVSYDSSNQRLFISDLSNSRIMIFNVATSTLASGENASSVLGQVNFTSSTSAASQNQLLRPFDTAYDPVNQRLFAVQDLSNRVTIFNVATSTLANGENASSVLGQVNFTASSSATTQSGMNSPLAVAYDSANERLFVSDSTNHRVLIYQFITFTTTSLASGTIGSAYNVSVNTTSSQGSVTLATSTGDLPAGLVLGTSTITGTPVATGTVTFSLQATDDNGAMGTFVSNPVSFTLEIDAAAAPIISSIATSSITSSGATITWTTNVTSTGQINYGTTNTYGSVATESVSSTANSVTLSGLSAGTLYHFQIQAGNLGTYATSSDLTFTTSAASSGGGGGGGSGSSNSGGGGALPNVQVYGLVITPGSSSTALVSWSTTRFASSTLSYGTTSAYGSTILLSDPALHASAMLTDLAPGVTYHLAITSRDVAGNTLGLSGDYAFVAGGGIISASSSAPSIPAPPLSTISPPSALSFHFTRPLGLWDRGPDVKQLQIFLNTRGFIVARTGTGSSGRESVVFGFATYRALLKFQQANGIRPTGFLGPVTRRVMNK